MRLIPLIDQRQLTFTLTMRAITQVVAGNVSEDSQHTVNSLSRTENEHKIMKPPPWNTMKLLYSLPVLHPPRCLRDDD